MISLLLLDFGRRFGKRTMESVENAPKFYILVEGWICSIFEMTSIFNDFLPTTWCEAEMGLRPWNSACISTVNSTVFEFCGPGAAAGRTNQGKSMKGEVQTSNKRSHTVDSTSRKFLPRPVSQFHIHSHSFTLFSRTILSAKLSRFVSSPKQAPSTKQLP